MRPLGALIWRGLVALGLFWVGPLPAETADDRPRPVPPPPGHPERLVPHEPLTEHELLLSRELGWTR
ncbi:DUF6059 family protein [Streptomyces caatingaensis]|uniref:Uncharacterized protein n=1 Tax=Streptomyces caatingaensis TaxID=1678637 RepID=A0A0K9XL64_9ACTN|nr:DUF6059 family protein [Streptomyces caatingaensis]KNB53422.1 hypothetical protein AC230_01735 [Streptomyces caatingaensis]